MTPNTYNEWASSHIWRAPELPRTWPGRRYNPIATDFANAVKAFQIQALLKADSKLGPATWSAMCKLLGKETRGVDVSAYQDQPSWEKVRAAGYEFAILKATEGCNYTDPTFKRNAVEAPRAGLRTTFYHYGTPQVIAPGKTPAQDAIEEARDFLDSFMDVPMPAHLSFTSSSKLRKADVWLDLEKPAPNITPAQGWEWINAWILTVEADGYAVGLYTKESWLDEEVYRYQDLIKRCDGSLRPFWVARYGSNSGHPEPQYNPDDKVPEAWGTYDVWQFTSEGSVPGIEGRCDLNLATLLA